MWPQPTDSTPAKRRTPIDSFWVGITPVLGFTVSSAPVRADTMGSEWAHNLMWTVGLPAFSAAQPSRSCAVESQRLMGRGGDWQHLLSH